MQDIPVVTQQTFILWSCCQRTGGVAQAGTAQNAVAQAPELSCMTAFTGSGTGDAIFSGPVTIRPVYAGNRITFEVLVNSHGASGKYTAAFTASTTGDAAKGLTAGSMSFTFQIVVYGAGHPFLARSFFRFRVGEEVDLTFQGTPGGSAAVYDVAAPWGGLASAVDGYIESYTEADVERRRFVGLGSGLTVAAVRGYNSWGAETNMSARLSGTCSRPGVYVFYLTTNAMTPLSERGYADPWNGDSSTAALMVSIVDDYFLPDVPVVVVPSQYGFDPNAIRVAAHKISAGDARYLTGSFSGSGDLWTRNFQSASWTGATMYWQYRIARTASGWALSGRSYSSTMSEIPDFEVWATSARDTEKPPNNGWGSGVVIAGATKTWIDGYGFFDYKGVWAGHDCFEQQTLYTPQYDTLQLSPNQVKTGTWWDNEPEYRNNAGLYWYFDAESGEYVLAESLGGPSVASGDLRVEPVTGGAAIPYNLPTCEKYGAQGMRDLALSTGNGAAAGANQPPVDLALIAGKAAFGFLPYDLMHRQLIPLNGTSGDRAYTSGATFTYRRDYSTNYFQYGFSKFVGSNPETMHQVTERSSADRYVFTISPGSGLARQVRDGGVIGRLFAVSDAGAGISGFKRTSHESVYMITDGNDPYVYSSIDVETELTGAASGVGEFDFVFGSGRNPADDWIHHAYACGGASVSGSAPTRTTTSKIIFSFPQDVVVTTGTVDFAASMAAEIASVIEPDATIIGIGTQSRTVAARQMYHSYHCYTLAGGVNLATIYSGRVTIRYNGRENSSVAADGTVSPATPDSVGVTTFKREHFDDASQSWVADTNQTHDDLTGEIYRELYEQWFGWVPPGSPPETGGYHMGTIIDDYDRVDEYTFSG